MGADPYLEVPVAAPPDVVWRALRDPDEVVRWFGWDHDGLADEVALIFLGEMPPELELPPETGDVVVVDEAARCITTGAHRIAVAPAGDWSVVQVTRVIDAGEDGWEMFHADIDAIEEGWRTFLQQMAFALARHPGEDRATVFSMGLLSTPLADPAAGAAPGEPYAATLAGEELAGTVWFRSEGQLGLTVDGWGDGLLVLVRPPDSDATTVIGTTYGLAPAAVVDLQHRWDAWFTANGTGFDPT